MKLPGRERKKNGRFSNYISFNKILFHDGITLHLLNLHGHGIHGTKNYIKLQSSYVLWRFNLVKLENYPKIVLKNWRVVIQSFVCLAEKSQK